MSALLPFLQLCRLPTVFTAIADVFLGYLLAPRNPNSFGSDFLLLVVATSGLYLSGMVFNDVFDRRQDAVERPQRPIPSGRVSLRTAVMLGSVLMFTGIVSAAMVGTYTLVVAAMLTACILAYDGGLKRTPIGPVVMGGCRFLNLIMAASSGAQQFGELWAQPQLWVACGMGIYIVGVTWFARTEAVTSSRAQLSLSAFVINLGLILLIGWAANWPGAPREAVLIGLGVVVLTINRRLILAISEPEPGRVQASIRTALLSIIMLDAMLVFARRGPEGTGPAIAVAALLVPAVLLGRWIRLT